jgi:phage terminase large subunit-like protein
LEAKGAGLAGKDADPFSAGLAMVELPQTDSRMIPASQNFFQLIVEKKIAHDGDAALARHVGNVTADPKPRGAYRISKPRGSKKKIDSAIAAAIAAHRAQQPAPQVRRSVYEGRGPVSAG